MDFEDWWKENGSKWASLGSTGKLLAHEAWLAGQHTVTLQVQDTLKDFTFGDSYHGQSW